MSLGKSAVMTEIEAGTSLSAMFSRVPANVLVATEGPSTLTALSLESLGAMGA